MTTEPVSKDFAIAWLDSHAGLIVGWDNVTTVTADESPSEHTEVMIDLHCEPKGTWDKAEGIASYMTVHVGPMGPMTREAFEADLVSVEFRDMSAYVDGDGWGMDDLQNAETFSLNTAEDCLNPDLWRAIRSRHNGYTLPGLPANASHVADRLILTLIGFFTLIREAK